LHNLENLENDQIYEIHGNGYYYRCYNSDCELDGLKTKFHLNQIKSKSVPNCQKCNQMVRPHVLLFDEAYEEKWYRK